MRPPVQMIGIDGEGQDRQDGLHLYNFLAASNSDGSNRWHVEAEKGKRLTTVQCLEFLLDLPKRNAKLFSYSFNYDITKILTDVDDVTLYFLMRPAMRAPVKKVAFKGPTAVKWPHKKDGPYELNLQGTKFTVSKILDDGKKLRAVIWDIFRFFACKFTAALKDWKVGDPVHVKAIEEMKEKRADFSRLPMHEVREYCFRECQYIAELAEKLVKSHETAGLKLRAFYGAGSSGGAMLDAMQVQERIRPVPPEMKEAVASAFFGGRFEHSEIGCIQGPLYGKDISSAYPYHITFLPCLEHGKWRWVDSESELEGKRVALVKYGLGEYPGWVDTVGGKQKCDSWGPFPFRIGKWGKHEEGSIAFPIESDGGWIWQGEYHEAKRIWPHVKFCGAWVLDESCQCQPFKQIPVYYELRIRIGKEGPGLVIKLGVNSCYGKLAQSVGNAIFNNWIWAGLITSGCRAQVLRLMWLHQDLSNLLMVATDGIVSKENIDCPKPRDTETSHCVNDKGVRVPLGGWEDKPYPRGIFLARPGIYFPLNPTKEDIKEIKGRGVGRGVVLEQWRAIVDAYEKGDTGIRVTKVRRFCGAKTTISFSPSKKVFKRSERYGQWEERPVDMSFDPLPKREKIGKGGKLTLRRFRGKGPSAPYDAAIKSAEARELASALTEQLEQPDGDFGEIGGDVGGIDVEV